MSMRRVPARTTAQNAALVGGQGGEAARGAPSSHRYPGPFEDVVGVVADRDCCGTQLITGVFLGGLNGAGYRACSCWNSCSSWFGVRLRIRQRRASLGVVAVSRVSRCSRWASTRSSLRLTL